MQILSARIDELELPLVEPFETSFGVERRRQLLLLTLRGDRGEEGVAECAAARDPLYSSESVATARWMLSRYLLPRLLRESLASPPVFLDRARALKGHPMAKATVEMALWDLFAREHRRSLAAELGGHRRRIEVGVSVGIQPSVEHLVRRVGRYLEEGYRRVKLKVRPGWDLAAVRAVRRAYPDLRLWVDANQAYPGKAAATIARWASRYEVEQVEQPFSEHELAAHARLEPVSPVPGLLGRIDRRPSLARRGHRTAGGQQSEREVGSGRRSYRIPRAPGSRGPLQNPCVGGRDAGDRGGPGARSSAGVAP